MNSIPYVQVLALLLLARPVFCQISTVKPTNDWSGSPIDLRTTRFEVSHNPPDAIRRELLDTNTIRLIAESTGLEKKELATIALAPGLPDGKDLWLYQAGNSENAAKAYNIFSEKIRSYVSGRLDGHTRAFLLNSLTNKIQTSKITDPDLRALLEQRPDLAASTFERCYSGSYTNEHDDVIRTAGYWLRDGELAWPTPSRSCEGSPRLTFRSSSTIRKISTPGSARSWKKSIPRWKRS